MSHAYTRAIITAAGPNMKELMQKYSLPSFQRYGEVQGYEIIAHNIPTDGAGWDDASMAARWAKLGYIRQTLEKYELVVWIDADILIRRTDNDIASHLKPDDFQGFALEQVPTEHRINPNSGVWVIRRSQMSLDFLQAVETAGKQPGPWQDQGAIMKVLGWDRGDEQYHWARPGAGTTFSAHTAILPSAWNQPFIGPRVEHAERYVGRPTVPEPYAVHFMGMQIADRQYAMGQMAAAPHAAA